MEKNGVQYFPIGSKILEGILIRKKKNMKREVFRHVKVLDYQ